MSIEDKDVDKLLQLARLAIDNDSRQEFSRDLQDMLKLLDKLQDVDTDGVLPLTNPCDERQRLRADIADKQNKRSLFIKNAPESEAGLYLVPRVVDN